MVVFGELLKIYTLHEQLKLWNLRPLVSLAIRKEQIDPKITCYKFVKEFPRETIFQLFASILHIIDIHIGSSLNLDKGDVLPAYIYTVFLCNLLQWLDTKYIFYDEHETIY